VVAISPWCRHLDGFPSKQRSLTAALPQTHPLRRNVLELLANWRINVEGSENLSNEDRELIMNLSPAYLRWREETLQEGKQEMIENLLRVRFGALDEELLGIIPPMLQLPTEELTRLLLTLSRNELLERFSGQSS
jgi:hypothetical protein